MVGGFSGVPVCTSKKLCLLGGGGGIFVDLVVDPRGKISRVVNGGIQNVYLDPEIGIIDMLYLNFLGMDPVARVVGCVVGKK